MMKQFLTACIVAAASITAQPAMAQDAKAKGILDGVTKKVSALKSLKANFVLKIMGSGGKQTQNAKGIFQMKGQKYRVSMGKQEIICDTRTVWTYSKDANEVQVSAYNPAEQTISPAKLFTNFYDKEYTYKYTGQKNVAGKQCDVIELTPISKSKQFAKVELDIDKSSMIAGGTVFEKNGNKVQYEVSNVTPNAAVTDNTFTFDTKQYPGVEVVDLR